MQFVYGEFAGEKRAEVDVREYVHIFKVRRIDKSKPLFFRNLQDNFIYTYKIDEIGKKRASLILEDKKEDKKRGSKFLHVGWCVVDPKTVEKNISMLNELGVSKISFVYSEFSQKNFKIDFDRLKRILINSCEQCGKSSLIEIEVIDTLKEYLDRYQDSIIIDFADKYLDDTLHVESFLVGPEGGFSDKERELFSDREVFGLRCENILRSETAVVGVCSKLLV
jgi:16S rRNA (uracil1498-N3)-methyltransferase